MKSVIVSLKGGYSAMCREAHSFLAAHKDQIVLSTMILGGLGLVGAGLVDASHAGEDRIADVLATILQTLIEGSFGALIMVVAGLTAIVAAAMGAYRAAMACLIVAVGAFVLRTFVTIFFGDAVIGTAADVGTGLANN